MNRISRMLMVSGLGVVAAATLGAGPAMAATGSSTNAAGQATTNQAKHWDDDDERVVGYYRDYRRCVIAGRIGERFDRWDDAECVPVGGFHRRWALVVEDNDDWDDWSDSWYNWDRDDFGDRGPGYYNRYHHHRHHKHKF